GGRISYPAADRHPMLRLLLGVSLGANGVLLVGILSVFLLAQAGAFAPRPQGSATSGTPLGSPTTTAVSSPPSGADWLTVAPTSVSLGCNGGQETQMVVLANTGPQAVRWQADLVTSTGQAGIAVDPNNGELAAGTSLTIKLHNTTHGGGQGTGGQHGVIRFTPENPAAGAPPSLNYTTVGCH
ncbi:MAG: hypothetical protein ACM3N4_02285, partial [Nitrososphaerota archaeon]